MGKLAPRTQGGELNAPDRDVISIDSVLTAESPSFVESPETTLTLAEDQSAMFTCNVDGAPKPTLIWRKGQTLTDVTELRDRRISVLPNGNLKIEVLELLAFHRSKLILYDYILYIALELS